MHSCNDYIENVFLQISINVIRYNVYHFFLKAPSKKGIKNLTAMKKTTCPNYLFAIVLLLLSAPIFSQNLVPFSPRYDKAIKGDILQIGNSNVGLHKLQKETNPQKVLHYLA